MFTCCRVCVLCLVVVFIGLPSVGATEQVPAPTHDDTLVLKACETAVQLGRQFSDSVWPGYNLAEIPFLVYVPEQWALLFNGPSAMDDFTDYPADWPEMPVSALRHVGQYRDLVGQLAFNVRIDSLTVATVAYTGQSGRDWLELLVHENFHQYQYARFGEIVWQREELYPIEDVENTALACLEVYLLRDALEAVRQSNDDSFRRRLREFTAVRAFRWQRATDYLRQYEQGLEINEGTAKYVEMKSISLVPRLQYASAFGGSTSPLTAGLGPTSMADCITEKLNNVIADGMIAPEDVSRNRVYPVGAAEGFVLDYLGVDWKPAAQLAGPDFTFAGLMAAALAGDDADTADLLAAIKTDYDYECVLTRTRESIAVYRAGFDSVLAVFDSQPGRRVELRFSGRNLSRSRNSSARKWLVDNGSRELRDHYGVYALKGTSGAEFRFQVQDAGLLEITDWSTRNKQIVFYCRDIDALTIDGAGYSPDESGEHAFESIQLLGSNFELAAGCAGAVIVSDSSIAVTLSR